MGRDRKTWREKKSIGKKVTTKTKLILNQLYMGTGIPIWVYWSTLCKHTEMKRRRLKKVFSYIFCLLFVSVKYNDSTGVHNDWF